MFKMSRGFSEINETKGQKETTSVEKERPPVVYEMPAATGPTPDFLLDIARDIGARMRGEKKA